MTDPYQKDLCRLADSYSAGELTPDEWRERMVNIREAKIEPRQAPERQGKKKWKKITLSDLAKKEQQEKILNSLK